MINTLISGSDFDYVSGKDKSFINTFDGEMERLGYTGGDAIGSGYCWGRHMIIYTKKGVKSKKSYARIYIRDDDIILRLYFSGIDRHRDFIENAPEFIRESFTSDFPACEHCKGRDNCLHRKVYTLSGEHYEICDGRAFWFFTPDEAYMPEYIKLFLEFYPQGKRKGAAG